MINNMTLAELVEFAKKEAEERKAKHGVSNDELIWQAIAKLSEEHV